LENRLDANTYNLERLEAIKRLKASIWQLKPLKSIVRFSKTILSDAINLPYLGLENIESNTGSYLPTSEKENFGSAAFFQEGQILFPKLRPYLNKVYLAEFQGVCSTEFHVLECSEINNIFLSHFLRSNIVVSQTKHLMSGNTLPRLQTEDIENLLIPIPPVDIQHQIVQKFEAAYASKRAKEAEATSLLASIDRYLLEALGITLPEVAEKKTFFVCSDKVVGGRFDPQFYKPEYLQLIDAINTSPNERLSHLVKFSSETWNQKDYFDEHFPYIEISEINLSKGTISNVSQIELSEAPSRAKMIVREGDIIVSTTRPSRGAIAKISAAENFSIASTGFAVIRHCDSTIILSEYLHTILRHRLCLIQLEQRSSGGNYPAITQEELGNIKIPIPSILVQQEIVLHINSIVEKAQQLEAEANAAVEAAKKEVEAMILGEGGSGA